MPYSSFTPAEVTRRLHLAIEERQELFPNPPQVEPSELLRVTLERNVPLALSVATEKARSEWIISPILLEIWQRAPEPVGLFSGVDFTVDEAQGLNGVCDFLLSRSPEQLFVSAPVLPIMEAKKEDIVSGIGQCGAAMLAARLFNEREGNAIPTVYGAVTTGDIWRFLKLGGTTLYVDRSAYYLDRLNAILGILLHIADAAPGTLTQDGLDSGTTR
jgi:hypothetical protein